MCCDSNLYEVGENRTLFILLIVLYLTSVYIAMPGATNIPLLYVWLIFMEGTSSDFSEEFKENSLAPDFKLSPCSKCCMLSFG
jgi:hypothetical protein